MEDILKRLGNVETSLTDLRVQVSGIEAVIPHLATAASISAMEATLIKWIIGTVLSTFALAIGVAKFIH